jgi:hypothetical protein
MKKYRPQQYNVKRLFCLNNEIDEKLDVLADASYTNKSQILRSLINDSYKNLNEQQIQSTQSLNRVFATR